MPRRPARRPAAGLDLSFHLLEQEDLSDRFDPRAAFPRPGPVELEVGSGKGLFLTSAAAAAADRNFLGIEIAHGYARLTAGRLAAAAAANARIIRGDAGFIVGSLLPDACLAGMHVYFPDPWWKARHRKRRVLSGPFLAQAGRVLASGSLLHIWTDVEEYFHEALAAAAATGLFGPPAEEVAAEPGHDLDYRTHFERRSRLAGLPVWRAAVARSSDPAPVRRITGPPAHRFAPPGGPTATAPPPPGKAAPPPASDSGR